MKHTTLVIALLVVLIGFSWISAINSNNSKIEEEFSEHIASAENCVDRGLYERAIAEYDAALKLMPNEEAYAARMEAYSKRYEEYPAFYSNYLKALKNAVSDYPMNIDYILRLAKIYKENNKYVDLYKALQKAVSTGIKDSRIDDLLIEAKYAYKTSNKYWDEVGYSVNGYYCVVQGDYCGYSDEDGVVSFDEKYIFAGPRAKDGTAVVSNENGSYIIDDGIILGKLDFVPEASGIFSEGLVPICHNGVYSYYDSFGDAKFGEYNFAGAFKNGKAAVSSQNKWYIINENGTNVTDELYDEIFLSFEGYPELDGTMAVRKGNSYLLINDDEEIGNYSGIGLLTEDKIIAVKSGDRWGYVDFLGKEIIPPQYVMARSFSNGLAAVSNGNLWGFINKDGKLVIDYTFVDVGYFNSVGACTVKDSEGKWQFISLYNFN